MSGQERIRIQQTDAPDLELCLEVFDADEPPGMIPAPGDIADAILNSSDDWWVEFLRYIRNKNDARHRALLQTLVPSPIDRSTLADVAGGDVDPSFGVDPGDSARLLELRQAIDSYLGWKSKDDEEHGDYVFRIREIGDMLWNCKSAFIEHHDAELMARIVLSVTKHAAYLDPVADRKRAAGLVTALRLLFEKSPPPIFTDRTMQSLSEILKAWEEHLNP